jgi:rod shape-determining protein MreD
MPTAAERPINVYRIHPLTMLITAFSALVLQTFLKARVPLARQFDLPLLAVIYFSVIRRNKVFGTVVGAVLGLAEDLLGASLIGIFGIAGALAGYLGAWASVQFDLEQFLGRLALTAALVLFQSLAVAGLQRVLIASPQPFQTLDLASRVLLNSALALVLFQVLDRFRRPA